MANVVPEESLASLDSTISKLAIKVHRLDNDIVTAVREQSKSQAKGRKDLGQAKTSVQVFLQKIRFFMFTRIYSPKWQT